MTCLALLQSSAHSSVRQGSPPPTREKVEELAALGRLWGEVKFVHPWLYSRDIDWDAALLSVIPEAIGSQGPEEFRAVVAKLLATLNDPITRLAEPASSEESGARELPASLERDGGNVLLRAPVSDQGAEVLRRVAKEPRGSELTGAIFDLRGAAEAGALESYRAAFEEALRSLLRERVQMPAWRHVKFSGFPPEKGDSSGGYTREFQTTSPRWLEGEAEEEIALVFIIDEGLRAVGDHLLALQLGDAAAILLESEREDLDDRESQAAIVHLDLPHGVQAEIRASERIGPSGEVGFRPDVHLLPSADASVALEQARSILSGELESERPDYPRVASDLVHRPELAYADQATLGPEHRLLALFRYWCTIEHFQPYLHLIDRPWDEILTEFVPRFLAAEDTLAYGRVVAELATCTQDSHSFTISQTILQEYGVAVPKIALRFVEDRPVVVAIPDPAIEGVSVGDVLLAIDGSPIEERIEALRPLLAHSTPQGLDDKLRDLLLAGEQNSIVRASFEGPHGIRECSLVRTEEYVQGTRSTPVYGILPSGHGYMDLERLQIEQIPAAFEAVASAPGLIFDLRGYPNRTGPWIAPRLGEGNAPVAAVFYRKQIGADAPGVRSVLRFEQRVPKREAGIPSFSGPVAVLIDERAVSQAEHVCLALKAAAKQVTFIGTTTNGTNGDMTNSILPGGIVFGFTGHDVRHADESQLQRRGIQPDIVAAPTIEGIRAGRDEVLERAVRFLESKH